MFFGNPQLLQRNLHADFNTLIKNVKARQDQYLTMLQYNKNLISNLAELQHMSFFSDQVNKHKSFFTTSQAAHQHMNIQQQQIKQKYQCVTSGEASIVKLLGRVISRVLQICQISVDKGKFIDIGLGERFGQFKNGLMDKLNESGKINIQCMLDSIIDYSVEKDKKQIDRLNQIIQILIKGDFQKLTQIYQPPRQLSPKKSFTQVIQQKPLKKLQHTTTTSQSPQKSKSHSPQKAHQQQLKNIEKVKKKKTKVIKQLLTNMYSILDLSKQQFNQDFVYTSNPQQKKKRLYEQIFSRNKFNYQQIIQFQSKKTQFQQKVKQFKAMMQMQSRKIQQALVVVINKPIQPKISEQKPKVLQRKQTKSDAGQNQLQDQVIPQRLSRVFRRRDKKQPSKAQSPRFAKETTFTSMQSTQQGFQHIKFDMRNEEIFTRSNRARLPQIPGRSSLDNRYQTKNASRLGEKKQQKRINIMKNIEIGTTNNLNTVKNSINSNNSQSNKKSPRDKSVGEQIFDNIANINLNANGLNGLDYTFYVRKKVSKFYEKNNNFIM